MRILLIQQQKNSICGIFAIADATEILHGEKVESLYSILREPTFMMISNRMMDIFWQTAAAVATGTTTSA